LLFASGIGRVLGRCTALGLIAVRGPYSNLAGFGCDDSTTLKFIPVPIQDDLDHARLSSRREPRHAEDAAVRDSPDHGELTEVLVKSDENSTLGQSRCQDFFISWIFIPVARPNDVVTSPEHVGCTTPDACVEEELHVPLSIVSNSIRS
jgi:hypothetical protein